MGSVCRCRGSTRSVVPGKTQESVTNLFDLVVGRRIAHGRCQSSGSWHLPCVGVTGQAAVPSPSSAASMRLMSLRASSESAT